MAPTWEEKYLGLLEDIWFLMHPDTNGLTEIPKICERLGVKPTSVARRMYRHGHSKLGTLIERREKAEIQWKEAKPLLTEALQDQ